MYIYIFTYISFVSGLGSQKKYIIKGTRNQKKYKNCVPNPETNE